VAGHDRILADYGLEDQPDWRTVRWAEHLRAVTVNGRRVSVVSLGRDRERPVLLVHGLGGRWQTWLGNLPSLAGDRRVVALDLPGFGQSQLPVEAISVAGYVQTLERVCDLLELDAPLVAGHGLGGLLAAELALGHPERVGALALIGTPWDASDQVRARAARITFSLSERLTNAAQRAAIARPRARALTFGAAIRHPDRVAPDLLYELLDGLRAPGGPGALRALRDHGSAGALAELAVPALVVHGAGDLLVPAADGERLAVTIPGARLELFADCGHMPMLEHPRRFNALLARFAGEAGRAGVSP
jgi:pimeloyl-ACP methyl ester carboxylesterase